MAWFRAALRGRRAAKAALTWGADRIVLCTIVDAPLLPRASARYLIYGDATPRQLDCLYYNDPLDSPRKAALRKKLKGIVEDGHLFLCMSNWYRSAVIEEYGVGVGNAVLLPPCIDTELWKPSDRKDVDPLRALFVGGDFERKGGDLVLDLAKAFSGRTRWDLVTSWKGPTPSHVTVHAGMEPDSPALTELTRSCDVLVFPTRADCSPNVILEASASGLAVIATDVGGISDMVIPGVTGVLLARREDVPAQAAAALEGYLADRAVVVAHGKAGREKVQAENSIPRHMSILTDAINS